MRFNFFKKKKEPENLGEILTILRKLEEKVGGLSLEVENLKKEIKFPIQKFAIVRFNPFSNIGSDQSFSIALLDGKNNGFVITSLYSREGNRIFAKPIEKGNSIYPLSKEEKEAIEKAIKSKEIESP